MDIFAHLYSQVQKADVCQDPTPHFFVSSAFPDDFYQELLDHLPETSYYEKLSDTYDKRFLLPLTEESISSMPLPFLFFWMKMRLWLSDERWMRMLIAKFHPALQERFGREIDSVRFSSVMELLRDFEHYSIGPHTDHPMRGVTLLFYFPKDACQAHLGTSFYRPLDSSFTCEGRVHHPFEGFAKVKTLPFLPNSILGFVKTDRSFHGVEELRDQAVERNLLNYYLRITD